MAVHFKFKSARDFDKVNIEGPFIPVSALKDRIVEAKNLGKVADFDLVLTNAQTGEEYADESFLVPKNTSVIVRRVPATRPRANLHALRKPESGGAKALDAQTLESNNAGISEMDQVDDFGAELAPQPEAVQASADEESKFKAAVIGTAADWQQQQNQQGAGRGGRGFGRGTFAGRGNGARGGGFNPGYARGPPPPGYVCHRCGIKGHWIQECPTNGDPDHDKRRVLKAPVGIPKSMLTTAADGSYVLPSGDFAALRPDESEFAKHAERLMANRPSVRAIPPEYQCPLCSNLFRDAVLIPCCQESFCDQCIREELVKSGKCPSCGATNITNDDLLPNLTLRKAIERFKSEQAATATTSSADDRANRHVIGPDATVSQNVPKSPSTLPSRAPEDLQTRNSSGAESSAPLSTAEAQEQPAGGNILGQSKAAGSERAFSAGRGTGGVEVGSEAVKALGRARSPLYESEHQRPRSSGGPPLHKEMADAMVARAGDWSDMNGGAGALPYGGVAVNKARMKELQEQHRCLICGSPDHPTADCPHKLMADQFPGPFRGPEPGPYPPEYYGPPPNEFFPGPQPYPPQAFGGPFFGPRGPPYGPEEMYYNGPMDPAWRPPVPARGGPLPYGGPAPFPPRPGYEGFPRGPAGRVPGPRPPIPSREEFERMQEEARQKLESKKRVEREESSDISERSHKKRDKEEKKLKKSRREKESRYDLEERGRGEEEVEDAVEERPSRRREKHRESEPRGRYDEDDVKERTRLDRDGRRREKSTLSEDVGRKSSFRPESTRRYPEDDHWNPSDDVDHRVSRADRYESKRTDSAKHESPSKHAIFSRLRYSESDGLERSALPGRSRRSRSPNVHERKSRRRDLDGRHEHERHGELDVQAKGRRRQEGPVIEEDDRWTAYPDPDVVMST